MEHTTCTVLPYLATAVSCDVEGEIRLDYAEDGQLIDQTEYYLIQVCILGQWSYVCNSKFDHEGVDTHVVLQQLQCSSGSKGLAESHLFIIAFIIIIAATKHRQNVSNLKPGSNTSGLCWS